MHLFISSFSSGFRQDDMNSKLGALVAKFDVKNKQNNGDGVEQITDRLSGLSRVGHFPFSHLKPGWNCLAPISIPPFGFCLMPSHK